MDIPSDQDVVPELPGKPEVAWFAGIAVAILFLISLIGNVVVTFLFWNNSLLSRDSEGIVFSCASGLLLTQPCLLAIWAAAVKQRLVLRLLLSMGILLILGAAYIATFCSLDSNLPLEVPLAFAGIVLVLLILIVVPLLVARRKTGCALHICDGTPERHSDSQFSIRHMLVITTIAAIVIALLRAVFRESELDGDAPWGEIFPFLLTFETITALVTLLSFAFVYFDGSRLPCGIILTVLVLASPLIVATILSIIFGGGTVSDYVSNTYAYVIPLAFVIVSVLTLFRVIGYRWRRSD